MIVEREREKRRDIVCVCVCVYTMCVCAFSVKEAGKQKGCARMEGKKEKPEQRMRAHCIWHRMVFEPNIRSFPNSFCLFARQKREREKQKNEFNAIKLDKI